MAMHLPTDDMLSRYVPARFLRSSGAALLTVPEARPERHGVVATGYYSPSLWNSLPIINCDPKFMDVLQEKKIHLFSIAFTSGASSLVLTSQRGCPTLGALKKGRLDLCSGFDLIIFHNEGGTQNT